MWLEEGEVEKLQVVLEILEVLAAEYPWLQLGTASINVFCK